MFMVGMITSSDSSARDDDELLESSPPGSRRKARELALQGLYAMEYSKHSVDQVMKDLFSFHDNDETVKAFTRLHIEKTREHEAQLDDLIRTFAANWDFERIATVDRIILRMAICEFIYFWDIPPKVSIDEAIELSKCYSTEQSSRFVNGILDAILLDLKDNKKLIKVGRGLQDGEDSDLLQPF
jgi:N utilization substance protein B